MDLATDAVIEALCQIGTAFTRVNTEDLPFSGTIDYEIANGQSSRPFFPSQDGLWFSSVWYRRMRVPAPPSDLDPGVYDFCVRETRSALIGGMLGADTRWMSNPAAIWKAEFKPHQLHLAKDLGFDLPRTLISNNPDSILAFHKRIGDLIAKPVRSGHLIKGGSDHAVFTTLLRDEEYMDLSDASLSPTIYQELIPKKYDIRATVVGNEIFAVAIDSQSDPSATIDWRRTNNPQLPHFAITLPENIERSILLLMSRLSLTYGAIDLVLTPDDRYIFLEINPNGQWLWLDDILSLGISQAIAEWLSRTGK